MKSRQRRPTQKVLDNQSLIHKPRALPRCHICPNKPLKSECGCLTKKRTTRPVLDIQNSDLQRFDNTNSLGESNVLPGLDVNISSSPLQPYHQLEDENQDDLASHISEENEENDNTMIDPRLLAISQAQMDSQSIARSNSDDDWVNDNDQDQTIQQSPKKVIPSSKNAPWGFVDGVQKGSLELVARPKALRPKISEIGKSTTRYRRELPNLIARCERLAEECDAYIILMSQQAIGSSATIHYTSPRLRREAKTETIDIIKEYQGLMNNLVLAKREDAKLLAKQLQAAKEETNKAKREAELAEQQIHSQQSQLVAQSLLVKELEAKLDALMGSQK